MLAAKLTEITYDKNGNVRGSLSEYGLLPDDVAHLPKSETGVWIYYLTKGIEKDFSLTWKTTPVSLKEKQSFAEKAKAKGKRVLSKKEKNELLAARNYPYYQKDIDNGVITMQEAFASMAEAAAKVKELEDAGYYLSPNKTQGVALFDWKSELKQKYGDDDSALKIYSRHSIIPIIPWLEDKLNSTIMNPKVKKELDKSIVTGIRFVNTNEFLKNTIDGWEDMKKHYEPRTLHIAQIHQSGKMKDRWFVVDDIRNKDKAQVLLMWDKNGVDGILE